jgi:hypothetical protein
VSSSESFLSGVGSAASSFFLNLFSIFIGDLFVIHPANLTLRGVFEDESLDAGERPRNDALLRNKISPDIVTAADS